MHFNDIIIHIKRAVCMTLAIFSAIRAVNTLTWSALRTNSIGQQSAKIMLKIKK